MSAEGMKATVFAHELLEAMQKDGSAIERFGPEASRYIREFFKVPDLIKEYAEL